MAFDKIVSETEGMVPHSTHEWTELLLWQLTRKQAHGRAFALGLCYLPNLYPIMHLLWLGGWYLHVGDSAERVSSLECLPWLWLAQGPWPQVP